jgi:hypothetical protein
MRLVPYNTTFLSKEVNGVLLISVQYSAYFHSKCLAITSFHIHYYLSFSNLLLDSCKFCLHFVLIVSSIILYLHLLVIKFLGNVCCIISYR